MHILANREVRVREIGGFFELELRGGPHYHGDAIKLNSGRSCLKYIIAVTRPAKIYMPAFCCDSLMEPVIEAGIDYEYYHVDRNFELIKRPELGVGERLCYINYFGFKSDYVKMLAQRYNQALIVDNTQAFFEKPLVGIDTFYSPRKFFGVADGGYLYTDQLTDMKFKVDSSLERMRQLLGRYETDADSYYTDYLFSENNLSQQPIRSMSKLTSGILRSLDYGQISARRRKNFSVLKTELEKTGLELGLRNITDDPDWIPMALPILSQDIDVKKKLIEKKIYIPTYWPECQSRLSDQELELFSMLCPLPIDQRYNPQDMFHIASEFASLYQPVSV